MYHDYGAIHHLDVLSGKWIYRVFLLPNSVQVDLAFVPSAEFGARARTCSSCPTATDWNALAAKLK